jgi:3-deoxy-7-phosphoheptulonate synthase
VETALQKLADADLTQGLIIDCSHGNSARDPARQIDVAGDVARQIEAGQLGIRGVMLESHLIGGAQPLGPRDSLCYGQSITDACLPLDETLPLLERLATAIRAAR